MNRFFSILSVLTLAVLFLGCVQTNPSATSTSQPTPVATPTVPSQVSVTATTVQATAAPTTGVSTSTASATPVGSTFTGRVLAGTASPLIDFNKADYDVARNSDKLVVLYFYATWCPICQAEQPNLEGAFNELATDRVVGFRVNYNDGDTDDNERMIAREFGVAYQHTKVFLKGGQRVLKSPEAWDKPRYLTEINNNLG